MMPRLRRLFDCVPSRSREMSPSPKVYFGVDLDRSCKTGHLPVALVDILVLLSRHGTQLPDIFRRQGSSPDVRSIIKCLAQGRQVCVDNYNLFTLASVIKRFLLKLPGGVFGSADVELRLMSVLALEDIQCQLDEIHRIIKLLPSVNQHLLTLLCGLWYRISRFSSQNKMDSSNISISVAGSLFHSANDDIKYAHNAASVLKIMIEHFPTENVFGPGNLHYFKRTTKTALPEVKRTEIPVSSSHQISFPSDESGRGTVEYFSSCDMIDPEHTCTTHDGEHESGFLTDDRSLSSEGFLSREGTPGAPKQESTRVMVNGENFLNSTIASEYSAVQRAVQSAAEDTNADPQVLLFNKEMQRYHTISRFDRIRRRRNRQQATRREWFLSNSGNTSEEQNSSTCCHKAQQTTVSCSALPCSTRLLENSADSLLAGGDTSLHRLHHVRAFKSVDESSVGEETGSEFRSATPVTCTSEPNYRRQPSLDTLDDLPPVQDASVTCNLITDTPVTCEKEHSSKDEVFSVDTLDNFPPLSQLKSPEISDDSKISMKTLDDLP